MVLTVKFIACDFCAWSQGRKPIPLSVRLRPILFQLLAAGRRGDAQEDEDSTIQPHHILVIEAPNACADFCFRNRRDFVHHQSADGAQAVSLAWPDGYTKQRSIGWVSGECAHCDRIRHVETV